MPSVELLGGLDALKGPQILSVKSHAFGVASAKSLGNPSVVEGLSITELHVATGESKSGAKDKSLEDTGVVDVEVPLHAGSLVLVVANWDSGTDSSVGSGRGATEDVPHVGGVEELEVEVVGVVLDELDELDLVSHLFIGLFKIVFVAVHAVSSHIDYSLIL